VCRLTRFEPQAIVWSGRESGSTGARHADSVYVVDGVQRALDGDVPKIPLTSRPICLTKHALWNGPATDDGGSGCWVTTPGRAST